MRLRRRMVCPLHFTRTACAIDIAAALVGRRSSTDIELCFFSSSSLYSLALLRVQARATSRSGCRLHGGCGERAEEGNCRQCTCNHRCMSRTYPRDSCVRDLLLHARPFVSRKPDAVPQSPACLTAFIICTTGRV